MSIKKAEKFIINHKSNNIFKPKFHFAPIVGWINDPNGFSFFNGLYHLFFQYNPYSSKWGRMHWGHATSKDLINWKNEKIALAPDTKYDNFLGCFSGSAVEKDNKLYIMYTGVPFLKQHQLLAESEDGNNFEKNNSPVITTKNRPPKSGKFSFRDPKIFKKNDLYYCVVGASYEKGRQIALYKSKNLLTWDFIAPLLKEDKKTNGIYECPDLIQFPENKDLLIYSIMYTKTKDMEYQNIHSSVYLIGETDYKNGIFSSTTMQKELDYGCDFYAPQTMTDKNGRIVLIAWMNNWLRKTPVSYLKHNWCGMMTLPRELKIENNLLLQRPIKEVYGCFDMDKILINEFIKGNYTNKDILGERFLIKISLDYENDLTLYLRKNKDFYTQISYEKGVVTFNREKSGYKISGKKLDGKINKRQCKLPFAEKIYMEIFVDTSSIEIFINNSRTMSSTIFPFSGSNEIEFVSTKGCNVDISFSPYINRI